MATTIDLNPRPPHGERLGVRALRHYLFTISTHVPRRGGATGRESEKSHPDDYFNPRSPWGATYRLTRNDVAGDGISIHAPRWGSNVLARSRASAKK